MLNVILYYCSPEIALKLKIRLAATILAGNQESRTEKSSLLSWFHLARDGSPEQPVKMNITTQQPQLSARPSLCSLSDIKVKKY